MSLWNPWKNKEAEQKRGLKEQADYETSNAIVASPNPQHDEQAALEKRDVLVQLNQWQQDRSGAMLRIFEKLSGYQLNKKKNTFEKVKWDQGYCSLIGAAKLSSQSASASSDCSLRAP